ncbi:uncharacterized protein LOC134214008 [Armigeres subalbatus]|uniref:uncharacterized protein LOC134214008 n=1 Tax=Armigeres subalbatus TaxID=124917 RepID=UPI002ED42F21
MDFSKKVRKSGLFYYRRRKILEKWTKENQLFQSDHCTFNQQLSSTLGQENRPDATTDDGIATGDLSGDSQFINTQEIDSGIPNIDNPTDTKDSEENVSLSGAYDDLISTDELDSMSLEESIRYWALKTNQPHQSINMIMDIIRKKTDGKLLPRSARSLLKTSRTATSNIVDIAGGQYWYYGIRRCLADFFRDIDHPISISINVNIDGIPVYKSSKAQLWPILFNIFEKPDIKPMAIALFLGNSKPESLEEFLRPFVDEFTDILNNGFFINGNKITIRLRCFICDTPARAFIKGVYGFNSKNGCIKCTCEGEYSYESRTVVFTSVNCAKRNDHEFRTNAYSHHQKTITPLIDIPNLDLIQDIIVADRLHLIDLGLMKRLLLGWRDGTLGYAAKLSALQINDMTVIIRTRLYIIRTRLLWYTQINEKISFINKFRRFCTR